MTIIQTHLIIWLLGMPIAYSVAKWSWIKQDMSVWTVGDRRGIIVLTVLASWVLIVAALITYYIHTGLRNGNKPANW